MKLLAGIALSVSVLVGENQVIRPEAFLTQGNIIQYESNSKMQGGEAARTSIALEITAVSQKNGRTIAKGELTFFSAIGLENMVSLVQFASDSVKFCANTTNWFYIPKARMRGTTESYSGDSLVYPFSMRVGDSLPDGHASRSFRSNSFTSTEKMVIHHRFAAASDSLELKFKKISAFRIESILSAESVASFEDGSDKKSKSSYVLVEWFSPIYGLVKSECRYSNGYSISEMSNPSVKK